MGCDGTNGAGEKPGLPMPLLAFCRQVGRSYVTGWRWVRAGWLETINIAGRPYVTPEAAAEFCRRAAAGEFAKPPSGAAAAASKACREFMAK